MLEGFEMEVTLIDTTDPCASKARAVPLLVTRGKRTIEYWYDVNAALERIGTDPRFIEQATNRKDLLDDILDDHAMYYRKHVLRDAAIAGAMMHGDRTCPIGIEVAISRRRVEQDATVPLGMDRDELHVMPISTCNDAETINNPCTCAPFSKSIDMRHRELTRVSPCIGKIRGLRKLDLSFNMIEKLEWMDALPNLVNLDVRSNFINKISDLGDISTVHFLDLSGNPISKIDGLEKYGNLKDINVKNTSIPAMDCISFRKATGKIVHC